MSDVDDSTPTGDDQPANPRKRFTMKSLNELVDDVPSSPAPARPESDPDHQAPSASVQRAAVGPSARRRLLDEVSGAGARRGPRPEPRTETSGPRRATGRSAKPDTDEVAPLDEPATEVPDEPTPDELAPDQLFVEAEAPVEPAAEVVVEPEPEADPEPVAEAPPTPEAPAPTRRGPRPASPLDEVPRQRPAAEREPIPAAEPEMPSPQGGGLPSPIQPTPPTSTAAAEPPAVSSAPDVDVAERETAWPLARQMLDQEVAEGGRVSNPHDVAGLVLGLAKDLPAAAAVSVVRVDEEVELVGNTIDPEFDPAAFAMIFSGLMRALHEAQPLLANGPLGEVDDVVIRAEHMDLVLRPLGSHFYLLVIEDRRSPHADLAGTRLQMAAVAPGLAATLAHDDGLD